MDYFSSAVARIVEQFPELKDEYESEALFDMMGHSFWKKFTALIRKRLSPCGGLYPKSKSRCETRIVQRTSSICLTFCGSMGTIANMI